MDINLQASPSPSSTSPTLPSPLAEPQPSTPALSFPRFQLPLHQLFQRPQQPQQPPPRPQPPFQPQLHPQPIHYSQHAPHPLPPHPYGLPTTMNGINGGNMGGGMAPIPAGHQAELNYIYGIVEELSRQLAENQRAMQDMVEIVGKVRNKALEKELGNDELLSGSGDELKAQTANLDMEISLLTEALEKAKSSRDANAALLNQYANVMAGMLRQFHEYKARHVADVAAWHRSYRAQLAEARAENCRLREQIWEMQARAGKANELLRKFRARYEQDTARWDRRVEARAVRQELRFWKRLAMPYLPEDDPYWSDDDDLIDVAEKRRLAEEAQRRAEEQRMQLASLDDAADAAAAATATAGDEDGEIAPEVSLGGVPMQREDSGLMPFPPPRPSSAASTGSSGQ